MQDVVTPYRYAMTTMPVLVYKQVQLEGSAPDVLASSAHWIAFLYLLHIVSVTVFYAVTYT